MIEILGGAIHNPIMRHRIVSLWLLEPRIPILILERHSEARAAMAGLLHRKVQATHSEGYSSGKL